MLDIMPVVGDSLGVNMTPMERTTPTCKTAGKCSLVRGLLWARLFDKAPHLTKKHPGHQLLQVPALMGC